MANLTERPALVSEQALSYSDDDVALSGVLVSPAGAASEPVPGILLVHGGAGLDDHARSQAARYAALGFAVFACDVLGAGVAGDRERIIPVLMALRDEPERLARRAHAGLDILAARPEVSGPIGAVGFCFGGMAALTLARCGANVAAVVSMHGTLATSRPAEPGGMTARVLVCHGALDPHVPMADVTGFCAEMTQAGVDYQVNIYGGAVHGFTHEHAVPGAIPGVAFHAEADRRSFAAARAFLGEQLRG